MSKAGASSGGVKPGPRILNKVSGDAGTTGPEATLPGARGDDKCAGRAMVPLALRGGGVGGGSPGGRRSRRGDEPLRPGARASAHAGVWARCARSIRASPAPARGNRPRLRASCRLLPRKAAAAETPGRRPRGGLPRPSPCPGPRRTSAPRQVGRFRRYSRKRSSGLAQDAAAPSPFQPLVSGGAECELIFSRVVCAPDGAGGRHAGGGPCGPA